MLISPAYKELNKQLHDLGNYGVSGHKWAKHVIGLCDLVHSKDVLDYGCGQQTLEKALGWKIKNYDPCIDGLDEPPVPADIVICGDVLEHIEPDCLDAVLDDLKRVVKQAGFFVIASRPAEKTLPDGRNAHLIQEGPAWWMPKFFARFNVMQFNDLGGEFIVVVRP